MTAKRLLSPAFLLLAFSAATPSLFTAACAAQVTLDGQDPLHPLSAKGVTDAMASLTSSSLLSANSYLGGGNGSIQAAITAACGFSPHKAVQIPDGNTDGSTYSNFCADDTTKSNPVAIQRLRPGSYGNYYVSDFGASKYNTDNRAPIQAAVDKCDADGKKTGYYGQIWFNDKYPIASYGQYTPSQNADGSVVVTNGSITSVTVTVTGGVATAVASYSGGDPALNRFYKITGGTSAAFTTTSFPSAPFGVNGETTQFIAVDTNAKTFSFIAPPGTPAGTYSESGATYTNTFSEGIVYKSCQWRSASYAHMAQLYYTGTDTPDTLVLGAGGEVAFNMSSGGIDNVQLGAINAISTNRNFYTVWPIDNNFDFHNLNVGPAYRYNVDIAGGYTNVKLSGTYRVDGVGMYGTPFRFGCASSSPTQGITLSSISLGQGTMATRVGVAPGGSTGNSLIKIDMTSPGCVDFGTLDAGAARWEFNVASNGLTPEGGLVNADSWGTMANKSGHIHLHDISIQNQVFNATTHRNYFFRFTSAAGDASGVVGDLDDIFYSGISSFKGPGDAWNGTGAVFLGANTYGHIAHLSFGAVDQNFRGGYNAQSRNATDCTYTSRGPNGDAQPNFCVRGDGSIGLGPGGSTALDSFITRTGPGALAVNGQALATGSAINKVYNSGLKFGGVSWTTGSNGGAPVPTIAPFPSPASPATPTCGGGNAWTLTGTGSAAAGTAFAYSKPIPVIPGATYTYSVCADDSQQSSLTSVPRTILYSADLSTNICSATPATGSLGYSSVSCTIPGNVTSVVAYQSFAAYALNAGAMVAIGNPQLELGGGHAYMETGLNFEEPTLPGTMINLSGVSVPSQSQFTDPDAGPTTANLSATETIYSISVPAIPAGQCKVYEGKMAHLSGATTDTYTANWRLGSTTFGNGGNGIAGSALGDHFNAQIEICNHLNTQAAQTVTTYQMTYGATVSGKIMHTQTALDFSQAQTLQLLGKYAIASGATDTAITYQKEGINVK